MALGAAGPEQRRYTEEDLPELRVAIVHYWLVTWRGGEKVVASLLKLFPRADIYTLFYDANTCGPHLGNHRVFTSSLNLPLLKKQYQKLFPLYPLGIRSLHLREDYDLLISSESGPAKGIRKPGHLPHLCYIHTPMRYCWGYRQMYLESLPGWLRSFADKRFEALKAWDRSTVDNVDSFVANSKNVADRVSRYYGRSARTCYPPIALDLFERPLQASTKEFYLSFGALTPYKNVELLVHTFNQLKEPLLIIGDGSEREKLEKQAGDNIQFLGSLPFDEILKIINRSRALLFPGEEDFGMIPLEVMSQGVPVIAYKKGGALETVVENREDYGASSGVFFEAPAVSGLIDALHRFQSVEHAFDPGWIRAHARKFGEDRFLSEMKQHILELLNSSN